MPHALRLPAIRTGSRLSGLGRWLLASLLLLLAAGRIRAAEPAPDPVPPPGEILKTLRPGHPRLVGVPAEFARLRAEVKTDPTLGAWWTKLAAEATNQLTSKLVTYDIPDGLRLLGVSRRVVERSYLLGLAWQMTGDRRFADRIRENLEAAAGFPDWNPRHFLDTAEMAHGFAIGLDWCGDAWTAEQRAALKKALVEKALKPAQAIYRAAPEKGGWPRARHNWNQVCNGGIALGALAVADDFPELAGELLSAAVASLPRALVEYGPDGAWAEGPGYWNYATIYTVATLAAFESALGTDFGLSRTPGFSRTGDFALHIASTTGRTFNFADGRDGILRSPHLSWLARKFRNPRWAVVQKANATPHPTDLLWFDAALAASTNLPPEPLDRYFRGAEVVTLRNSWESQPANAALTGRNGLFVGFKAGDNKANHSHLDLGSFVFDVHGLRWVSDFGGDDYNLPGYFGKQRWDYQLLRAEGHSTLVINPGPGPDQDPAAVARILRFESRPSEGFAIADLTPAYAAHARRVHRGIALRDDRSRVQVRDEVEADRPIDLHWFLQTTARVELRGPQAILTLGTKRVWVAVSSPSPVQFSLRDLTPLPQSPKPASQAQLSGRKLALEFRQVKEARFTVYLGPLAPGAEPPPVPDPAAEIPLADWK